jgi:hypothetical protein
VKKALAITTIVIVAAVVTGVVINSLAGRNSESSLINQAALQGLPVQNEAGNIDTSHLWEGLAPPTNKWFSALALQKTPRAVFPTPLSFLPGSKSFEIGLPAVSSTEKTIFGPHLPNVRVEITDAESYKVIRYDELSVDLEYLSGDKKLGVITITAGSPYIFFKANNDTQLSVSGSGTITADKSRAEIRVGQNTSVIMGFNGAALASQAGSIVGTIPAGAHLTFYILPDGAKDDLRRNASNRITGAEVSYKKAPDSYQTEIQLKTANSKPTFLGLLSHQKSNLMPAPFNYQTIYGQQNMTAGNLFTFSTGLAKIQDRLDLSNLQDDQRQLLSDTLRRDINATQFETQDTYFSGKALYRAAQLLDMAHQLDEPKLAASIQKRLAGELELWFSGDSQSEKYFYYNPVLKGIVGNPAAFGSEEFNDHHFHYGYFIYAASILAKYDNDFLFRHKDSVNLLVADIANYNRGETLPLRRHFDPYFGHSWASGFAPFNDGNNQESSSEALNAWAAVTLWAQRIDDSRLKDEAEWMFSNEMAASNAYWLNFDAQLPPYNGGYTKSTVTLNWGGKRDYATFFSSDPNAILGIQLIPMNPSMTHSDQTAVRINKNTLEALPQGSYNTPFGDYILMYKSLSGIQDPIAAAQSLEDHLIDGANSRSYLYAWLFANGRQY